VLEDVLYRQMLRYRQRPDNIFTGTPDRMQDLYLAMQQASAGQ
jgi:hypothetical protein